MNRKHYTNFKDLQIFEGKTGHPEMKNIITEIEHIIFSTRYVLSQVLLIRSIKIAIPNKAATRTTLKKLICTILYH